MKPNISIVCPSYNHEAYVSSFIESVLGQTEQNFELIIIDDKSTDETLAVITTYTDPRIILKRHMQNQGINAGFNGGCALARADIVAFIASDDVLYPGYIERVLQEFEQKHIGAVYVTLQHMNQRGEVLQTRTELPELTRHELLQKSFMGKNPLPSPGMAFRKVALQSSLPLPIGMFQYSDWHLNNLLLARHEISFIRQSLIYYRISPTSASAQSKESATRSALETRQLMDSLAQMFDYQLLLQVFGTHEVLQKYTPTQATIPYILGRLALCSPLVEKQKWGYQTIMDFIKKEGNAQLLFALYGFDFKEYLKLAGEIRPEPAENLLQAKRKLKRYKHAITGLALFCLCSITATIILLLK